MDNPTSAPKHAYEVTVRIGGNTWDYVLRTMEELAAHMKEHGEECNISSGGYDGCHAIDIERRDISPRGRKGTSRGRSGSAPRRIPEAVQT